MAEREPTDPRERLAQQIRTRRLQRGLSIRAAAKIAGISPITWTGAEKGTRITAEHLFTGFESALRWQPGSVAAILDGGEPAPLDAADNNTDTPPLNQTARAALREVMHSDDLTETEKRQLIRMLVAEQLAEEAARTERELRRAAELIALIRSLRPGPTNWP